MKKTFYTGPLMMFYAAPFFVLMFLVSVGGTVLFIHDAIEDPNMHSSTIVFVGFLLAAMVIFSAYLLYYYSPKLFATLTFKDDRVYWRCVFHRRRVLSLSNCRIGVQLEESAFGPGYPHIFFTTAPYPSKYYNKINKIKCSDSFIKFWYREKIAEFLVENLPREQVLELKSFKARQSQMRRKKR